MSFLPTFSTDVIFYLAVLLITGLVFGKLAKLCRLPNVTGYIIGGLIIGGSVLKIVSFENSSSMSLISDIELSFIAFTIGCEFRISYFKRVGAKPIIIAIFESFLAIFFVLIVLSIFFVPTYGWPFILLLSAIAAATAPGATILIIRQYKAKGEVTSMLLSVVALDDSTALIGFGFLAAIATVLLNPAKSSGLELAFIPIFEILISIGIAIFFTFLLILLLKWFKSEGNRTSLIIFAIFITAGVAAYIPELSNNYLHPSTLLTVMILSALFVNFYSNADEIISLVDRLLPPIIILFFVLAGTQLNLSILPQIGVVGICYVVMRSIGKIFGAYLGAVVSKSPKAVKKYLGFCLLPQGGVEIGLAVLARDVLVRNGETELGDKLLAIILAGVLIYQIIGPIIAKISLTLSKEIQTTKDKSLMDSD